MAGVCELRKEVEWRGLGKGPYSALKINSFYEGFACIASVITEVMVFLSNGIEKGELRNQSFLSRLYHHNGSTWWYGLFTLRGPS